MANMFDKLVAATTNGFVWDQLQMRVRDHQWNDLTSLNEEGHFGKFCFKQSGRDKKQIFSPPKTPFLALLVIDKSHYEAYIDFDKTHEADSNVEVAATLTKV